MGKSTRMEKVGKSGSVLECVTELLKELGPLYRHIFNSEWQRDHFQRLKENLPVNCRNGFCREFSLQVPG